MLNTLNSVSLIMTTLRTGTVVLLLFLVAQVCEPLFFFQLYCILIKTQKVSDEYDYVHDLQGTSN